MSSDRPKLLGFMAWLIIIHGALEVIAGIGILVERNNSEIQNALDSTSTDATTLAVVLMVAGAIGILIGAALRGGANWTRLLIGILAVAHVVILIWGAIAYHQVHWYNVIWPTLIYLLIAGYLFADDDVKRYFEKA